MYNLTPCSSGICHYRVCYTSLPLLCAVCVYIAFSFFLSLSLSLADHSTKFVYSRRHTAEQSTDNTEREKSSTFLSDV